MPFQILRTKPWGCPTGFVHECKRSPSRELAVVRVNREAQGFTLVELVVAITVAAILTAVAIPSYNKFVLDAQRTAVVNDLLTSFQVARSEAVRRGREIGMCASADGTSCSSDNDWARGWMVFVNLNPASPCSPSVEAGEEVVRIVSLPPGPVAVRSNRGRYCFQAFSRSNTNGTVTVCDKRGAASARAVITALSGTVRVSSTNSAGEPLSCPST